MMGSNSLVSGTSRRGRSAAGRALLTVWLTISILLSQTIGLLHRSLHAPIAVDGVAQQPDKSAAGRTSAAGRFVASLVPKHESARGCEAFDQLSLGHALAGEPPAIFCEMLVWDGRSAALAVRKAAADARHDFEARAPPGTREGTPQRG